MLNIYNYLIFFVLEIVLIIFFNVEMLDLIVLFSIFLLNVIFIGGFLGNVNGNFIDDLILKNGLVLLEIFIERDIYFIFGEFC